MLVALSCAGCGWNAFNFTDNRLGPGSRGPWVQADVSDAEQRRDLKACWQAADAQVARDRRIDRDQRVRETRGGGGQGHLELRRDMTEFGYERRREKIVAECMLEKGYTRD